MRARLSVPLYPELTTRFLPAVSAVGTFERGARKPLQSKKVPITILDQPKLEYGAPAPTAEYFSSTAEDLSVSQSFGFLSPLVTSLTFRGQSHSTFKSNLGRAS